MPSPAANLILNPVRFRILTAISSYRMTAKEIGELLPDIPQTSLYRQINALLEGGLMQIVEEKQVRGTVERTYALKGPPSLSAEDLRDMTREECEQAFTVYLSSLMSDAQQYFDRKPTDGKFNPIEDGVQISKAQFFLDDEEFQALSSKIVALMLAAADHQPRAGRKRRMFSFISIPMGIDPSR